jgi:NAD(P)H-dependent FMN reductase
MSTAYTILAISGSLRTHASTTEVLRAAALLAPSGVTVVLFEGLGGLPHFNPDLDDGDAQLPETVRALRAQVDAADAILICSPEYAHGVPGSLKNALDWLVSGSEIPYKPVALLNASPRSRHAQAALAETLRTMSTILAPGAPVEIPLDGRRLNASAIAELPALAEPIRSALNALTDAVHASRERRRDLGPAA